jgi:hypothetical protein
MATATRDPGHGGSAALDKIALALLDGHARHRLLGAGKLHPAPMSRWRS